MQGRDLGGVASDIDRVVNASRKNLPRGSQIIVRGQIQTMRSSFVGLAAGLFFSILLVYMLIVVNFQSWLDPFIIITALPAALAGIEWMLFVTGTRVSVPALTGSIMCMGVATANSILVVSFAREQMAEGLTARRSRDPGGLHPLPTGADDCLGNDHRHVADGAGHGRRRRAERSPGTRRDRWIVFRHGFNALFCADGVQHHSRMVAAKTTED